VDLKKHYDSISYEPQPSLCQGCSSDAALQYNDGEFRQFLPRIDLQPPARRHPEMTYRIPLLPAFVITVLICGLHAMTLAAGVPAHLPVSQLTVLTQEGSDHLFEVSVATRPEDRRRGLMFVTELRNDQGMLFDYGRTSVASMWMKNTPMPLDMIFIRSDGSISSIARETTPYSRATITSEEPVRAVLELKGGTCRRLGIEPGDQVVHPIFEQEKPSG
jgi:uncharacterized membrane protein (UPF0127 family)